MTTEKQSTISPLAFRRCWTRAEMESADPLINKQNERSPSYCSLGIRPLGFQASFADGF